MTRERAEEITIHAPEASLYEQRILAQHWLDTQDAINIVFDGPPGPTAGRFVEVETDAGKSIKVGEWIDSGDGYWRLRIPGRATQWHPWPQEKPEAGRWILYETLAGNYGKLKYKTGVSFRILAIKWWTYNIPEG